MRRAIIAFLFGLLLTPAISASEKLAISVDAAEALVDEFYGQPVVSIRWTAEGQRAFSAFTREHVGKRVDLLVGDEVVTSPVVQSPLEMAEIQITGLSSLAEAEEIAARLTGKKARLFVRLAKEGE